MTKSKGTKRKRPSVSGTWLRHLQQIAQSRTARKTESSRDNLAKAREAKMMKRLGLNVDDLDIEEEPNRR